jgi:8-oxo-dGTP pyrophosphatase MutT (NUDIX family)
MARNSAGKGNAQADAGSPDYFIRAEGPLIPRDAVAGLLVLEDGRYIMQLRDALPNIFYPDHWGCFGGAIDAGESPLDALKRELREELEYEFDAASEFTRFDFDLTRLGQTKVSRVYYEVRVPQEAFLRLVLREGADMQPLAGADLLVGRKPTPYDAFAIWMHMSKRRFTSAQG